MNIMSAYNCIMIILCNDDDNNYDYIGKGDNADDEDGVKSPWRTPELVMEK